MMNIAEGIVLALLMDKGGGGKPTVKDGVKARQIPRKPFMILWRVSQKARAGRRLAVPPLLCGLCA